MEHGSAPPRRTARRVAGDSAEEIVALHLSSRGWRVIGRNLRVGRSELDILALEPAAPDDLIVIEVRSRSVPSFGSPEESVDAGKVVRLYRAARELVRVGQLADGRRLPARFRVDLVTVVRDGRGWRIAGHIRGLEPP